MKEKGIYLIKDKIPLWLYSVKLYVQSSLPLLRRFLLVSLCYIPIWEWYDGNVKTIRKLPNNRILYHLCVSTVQPKGNMIQLLIYMASSSIRICTGTMNQSVKNGFSYGITSKRSFYSCFFAI